MIHYLIAMKIIKYWNLSPADFAEIEDIIAQKYSIKKGSIYRQNDLT